MDSLDLRVREFVLQQDFEEIRLKELIQAQTIEEKKQQISEMSSLLKNQYLPTEINTTAFQLSLLLTLGIF